VAKSFSDLLYVLCISNVIKRAVNTAPEPEAIICWYGFNGDGVELLAISEEE
jgi:hypothetical protein